MSAMLSCLYELKIQIKSSLEKLSICDVFSFYFGTVNVLLEIVFAHVEFLYLFNKCMIARPRAGFWPRRFRLE